MTGVDDLLAADRAHVWHPYAAMPAAVPPLPVVSAQGVRLRLADGREPSAPSWLALRISWQSSRHCSPS